MQMSDRQIDTSTTSPYSSNYSGNATRSSDADGNLTLSSPTVPSATPANNDPQVTPSGYPQSANSGGANISSADPNSFPSVSVTKQVAAATGIPSGMVNYLLLGIAFVITLLAIRTLKK